jgi:hypothetical protein
MAQIHILVAVNVAPAITGNLGDYVYMVDDSLDGSSGEGGHELETQCENGDILVWTVQSIDPDLKVSIDSFDGAATEGGDNALIAPTQVNGAKTIWRSSVNGTTTTAQPYSMYLNLNNGQAHKTFDPYIFSKRAQGAKK